jgi:ribosomal protein S18 acetylase RimI-like enzyme
MHVRPLENSDLPLLHRLYCAVTGPLPHGFSACLEEFAAALRNHPAHLRRSMTQVAVSGGEPVAFARAGLAEPVPDRWMLSEEGQGLLFGPIFAPERAEAGAALLAAARKHLRERGVKKISAFDPIESVGMPFYNGGWCSLSERLPHILGLLARHGFRVRHREFCMTRPDLPAPDAEDPGFPYDLRYETRDQNRYTLRLYDRDTYAGVCRFSRMFPLRSARREAERWGYIDGLGVTESYQGRGLGRVLMEHTLARLRRIGCGPVCLTTGSENYRAQNLYFSLGFALVDSGVTLLKDEG